MRILAASRDLREVFFFLENHQPGNCSCSTYANSENGTTSPQPSQSFVTDWYLLPIPSPNGDISSRSCHRGPQRRGPALATTATQDSQAPSTVHCCIPRRKMGVRAAMDHGWPDRVCSHVTVGERNKLVSTLRAAVDGPPRGRKTGDTSLLLIKKRRRTKLLPS